VIVNITTKCDRGRTAMSAHLSKNIRPGPSPVVASTSTASSNSGEGRTPETFNRPPSSLNPFWKSRKVSSAKSRVRLVDTSMFAARGCKPCKIAKIVGLIRRVTRGSVRWDRRHVIKAEMVVDRDFPRSARKDGGKETPVNTWLMSGTPCCFTTTWELTFKAKKLIRLIT